MKMPRHSEGAKRLKNPVLLLAMTALMIACQPCFAVETLKAGLQYSIPKNQKIELRVTQIPKKLPWLERNDDGSIVTPQDGSIIVAQNTEDYKITDQYGVEKTIPSGTKFYARVLETSPAKSFWRKGKAKLEFFAIDPFGRQEKFEPNYSFSQYNDKDYIEPSAGAGQVALESEIDYASKGTGLKDSLTNLSSAGGYALTGAIVAPFAIFAASKALGGLLAISGMTNPYVLGGASAVGATAGLAYGIMKKGKTINLEPGSELEITVDDPWVIVAALEKSQEETKTTAIKNNDNFLLEVLKVKKAKDEFGDPCLRVSVHYENRTKEELRYTSFQLVDSMGKEYEPSISSFSADIFGELPRQGNLDLYFNTDFPKTMHQLRALRIYDQKPLAISNVILE